jgi:hypothetical protein
MIVDNTDFTQAQTVQAVLELLEAKV